MKIACLLASVCLMLVSFQVPQYKGYINDYTNSISEQESSYLEQQLRTFEAMEGVRLVIVVLPSLEGEALDLASQKISSQWQVGPQGRDSGILLLAAKQESKSYVDLGYGMEMNITEEMARAISAQVIDPLLAKGKVYKAVEAGVSKIFADFGKGLGSSGAVNIGSFFDMTSLILFLLAIPLLYFTARFAASKHIWVSPTLGFLTGLTQSLGLAVTLGCMGGLMVLICYLIKTYLPPR